MTDTTDIPLNRLIAWDGNVRKTRAADHLDELAASITAHALLQSLIVRRTSRGRYAVIAGRPARPSSRNGACAPCAHVICLPYSRPGRGGTVAARRLRLHLIRPVRFRPRPPSARHSARLSANGLIFAPAKRRISSIPEPEYCVTL
jgi:ParB-like nuclease domain